MKGDVCSFGQPRASGGHKSPRRAGGACPRCHPRVTGGDMWGAADVAPLCAGSERTARPWSGSPAKLPRWACVRWAPPRRRDARSRGALQESPVHRHCQRFPSRPSLSCLAPLRPRSPPSRPAAGATASAPTRCGAADPPCYPSHLGKER